MKNYYCTNTFCSTFSNRIHSYSFCYPIKIRIVNVIEERELSIIEHSEASLLN